MGKMTTRLTIAIASSILEEMALAAGVLWGLPRLGVQVPLGGLIGMMVGLATWNVISWRMGMQALRRKPASGMETMIGSKGKVVSRLHPEGLVQISGELWQAISADEKINSGEEVIVVGWDGLKLIVSKVSLKESK